ncbi:hypothetical protein M3Y99_00475900 [Aphelenchoides fujianensis]|nr:hypothetical protein M3Y99_00475900 [Aphelenchoides fujianensis]
MTSSSSECKRLQQEVAARRAVVESLRRRVEGAWTANFALVCRHRAALRELRAADEELRRAHAPDPQHAPLIAERAGFDRKIHEALLRARTARVQAVAFEQRHEELAARLAAIEAEIAVPRMEERVEHFSLKDVSHLDEIVARFGRVFYCDQRCEKRAQLVAQLMIYRPYERDSERNRYAFRFHFHAMGVPLEAAVPYEASLQNAFGGSVCEWSGEAPLFASREENVLSAHPPFCWQGNKTEFLKAFQEAGLVFKFRFAPPADESLTLQTSMLEEADESEVLLASSLEIVAVSDDCMVVTVRNNGEQAVDVFGFRVVFLDSEFSPTFDVDGRLDVEAGGHVDLVVRNPKPNRNPQKIRDVSLVKLFNASGEWIAAFVP